MQHNGSTSQHLNNLWLSTLFAANTGLRTRSWRSLPCFVFGLRRLRLCMVRFLWWRCPRLFQCRRDKVVAWSRAVNKRKHVVVRVALTDDLDAALILDSCQLIHQEVLFCDAHITIVDVECETRRMWRRIDRYGVPVHTSQRVLVLLGSYQRTHR